MLTTWRLLPHPICIYAFESAVCVHSPPRAAGGQSDVDMYDPDTYYRKFEVYGEIVFITVCLKNGNLMKVREAGYSIGCCSGMECGEALRVSPAAACSRRHVYKICLTIVAFVLRIHEPFRMK